jgi:hypothetical protein
MFVNLKAILMGVFVWLPNLTLYLGTAYLGNTVQGLSSLSTLIILVVLKLSSMETKGYINFQGLQGYLLK